MLVPEYLQRLKEIGEADADAIVPFSEVRGDGGGSGISV